MKRLMPFAMLLPLLLLSACGGDDSQARMFAAKQCDDETMSRPVSETRAVMLSCMKRKGYVFDADGANCALAEISEESSNCYRKAD